MNAGSNQETGGPDPRASPEAMAQHLRVNPGLAAEAKSIAASVRVCAAMNNGKFRLYWSAQSIGDNDWVGLYTSASQPDTDYISGAWQWASKGSPFDTSVQLQPGYQARYLVWNAHMGKYVSIERATPFPSVTMNMVSSSYPRKPTTAEWTALQRDFPQLQYANTFLTAPPSGTYNCIAWALGLDDRWINPDTPLSAFESQMQAWGRKPVTYSSGLADLDAWALSSGKVTHGSKDYTGVSVGVGGLWESKLGPTERITHGRTGLTSTGYGSIVGTLGPGFNATAFERCAMVMNDPLPAYGQERLMERLQAVPPDLREAFERHFAAWKQTWFTGAASRSSDSKACATGEAFEALLAMGPAILPLVVERLQEEENFVALVLYDRLQSDPDLKITYEESDPRAIEGEQSRSQRTIRKWLDIE